MEFIYRFFRKLEKWWYLYRFRRRWRRTYLEATPIDGVASLYISECDPGCRSELAASFIRVWKNIPIESKKLLQDSWHRLQRRWDNRNTGIALRLPVIRLEHRTRHMGDIGTLIGLASISGLRNGMDVSPEADMEYFSSVFLPVWNSPDNCSAEELDLGIARSMASYQLWLRTAAPRGTPIGKFLHGYHDDTDELVKKWGFATFLEKEHAR